MAKRAGGKRAAAAEVFFAGKAPFAVCRCLSGEGPLCGIYKIMANDAVSAMIKLAHDVFVPMSIWTVSRASRTPPLTSSAPNTPCEARYRGPGYFALAFSERL